MTRFPGFKKLMDVEKEIQGLIPTRHPNLTGVFAVELTRSTPSNPPQLMVLSEQVPALTLHDVLEDCESLKEDRASVRLFPR